MEWIGTGREPLERSATSLVAAKRALGLSRATGIECLAWTIVHAPDWVPQESPIGKALARVLRRAELGHAVYQYAWSLGMERQGE